MLHQGFHIMQRTASLVLLTFLDRYRDIGLLILRIGLGLAFIAHGYPKITGGAEMWGQIGQSMQNFGITSGYTFWGFMAALAEFGGGILLLFGFLFRYACILLFINLCVAASFHYFRGDGFMGYAHALEAAITFFSLIWIGPGRFALDSLLTRPRPVPVTEAPTNRL